MTTKAYGVTMYAPTGGFTSDDRLEIPGVSNLFGKQLKDVYVKPQSKTITFEFQDGSWFEGYVPDGPEKVLETLKIGSFEINA